MTTRCLQRPWFAAVTVWALVPLGLLVLSVAGCANGNGKENRSAKGRKDRPAGGDWPMFGGTPQRNMANPVEKNLPSTFQVEGGLKNIKWSASIGGRGYGGPVVAGGQVYVGTNNDALRDPRVKGVKAVLMCFSESDGKFLWQLAHAMPPSDIARDALRDGLCSTPAIDGDRLYYVTPACEVVCASTRGKVLWSFDMMKKLKVVPCFIGNCSPLVVGDRVFVITGNGRDADNQLQSPKAPSFVAFHKKTGKLEWKSDLPGTSILEGQWANPAYGVVNGKGQVLFPGGDGWLYALEPDSGKLIWKFDCNPKDAVWKARSRGTRNYIIATPVVHDGKAYLSTGLYPQHPQGSGPGDLWCIALNKTGDVSPELVTDARAKPLKTKPNPNSALVWHFGGAIKPRPAQGREVEMGRTICTCAIHDGLLYIAEEEGFLHCLDAKTGRKYWEHDLKSAIWGSPYWVDGKIYLGDEDGDVLVFAHGQKPNLLATIEMGGSVLSTPVAAHGVLYVLTKSKLYAIGGK
jgi:outer membrane protein assembly factor BamB